MPICVYCRISTDGDNTKAHVFPEALGNRNLILPAGTECGKCNHYFGHELDSAIATHPNVAMALLYLDVKGKQQTPRKMLGSIERKPSEPGTSTLNFSIDRPKLTFTAEGGIEFESIVRVPSGFRLSCFRRGLHHVAMSIVAFHEGPEAVLDARFDPVRTYIRRPRTRSEAWSYLDDSPQLKQIPAVVWGGEVAAGNGKIIAMQFFQTVYVVDLLNSGELVTLAAEKKVKLMGPDIARVPEIVIKGGARPEAPPAA
jgi:hypothetical protein